jgi:hypothetical protein
MTEDRAEAAFRASPLFQELERINEKEDPSYFDSQAKRQHFVPRLMLRRFAREIDKKHLFYQLDVRTGAPRRVPIEDAASRRYFYAVSGEDGKRHNRVEGFLALVEGHASVALDRLLDDPESLSDPDRATLSFFFALLDPRTPGGNQQMQHSSDNSMRMLLATDFADAEAFANTYRHLFADDSDEEIEAFRERTLRMLETGEIGFADPKTQALRLGISVAGGVAYVVFDMCWTLLRRSGAFITSDRGLAMHDATPEYPWSGQGWGSSAGVEVAIPLTSDICLSLHHDEPRPAIQDVEQHAADATNLRMYGWANGYIYGTSQELVASVRQLAKRRPADVIRPIPHSQVLLLEADPTDTSIADTNARRGWPRYLTSDGLRHDYFVIGPQDNATAISARVSRLVQERAAKKMGLPPGRRPPGRGDIVPVSPFDLT